VRYIRTSPMTMSSPAFRVIGSPRHDDSLSCFFLRSVAHWRMGPCQLLTVMITSVVTALALYNAPVAACNRTFEPFVLRCSIAVGDAWLGLSSSRPALSVSHSSCGVDRPCGDGDRSLWRLCALLIAVPRQGSQSCRPRSQRRARGATSAGPVRALTDFMRLSGFGRSSYKLSVS
jgi:hypothetical protein